MTTILAIFVITLVFFLVLTPLFGRLGVRLGVLDKPEERKIHSRPVARCGGVGIFLSFLLALVVSSLFFSEPLTISAQSKK